MFHWNGFPMTFVSPQMERGLNVLNECLNFKIVRYTYIPISKIQCDLIGMQWWQMYVFGYNCTNQRMPPNPNEEIDDNWNLSCCHSLAMHNQCIETIINLALLEIDRFALAIYPHVDCLSCDGWSPMHCGALFIRIVFLSLCSLYNLRFASTRIDYYATNAFRHVFAHTIHFQFTH